MRKTTVMNDEITPRQSSATFRIPDSQRQRFAVQCRSQGYRVAAHRAAQRISAQSPPRRLLLRSGEGSRAARMATALHHAGRRRIPFDRYAPHCHRQGYHHPATPGRTAFLSAGGQDGMGRTLYRIRRRNVRPDVASAEFRSRAPTVENRAEQRTDPPLRTGVRNRLRQENSSATAARRHRLPHAPDY